MDTTHQTPMLQFEHCWVGLAWVELYLFLATKLQLNDLVCESVLPSRGNVAHIAPSPRGQHNLVVYEGVLVHRGVDVTARQSVSSLQHSFDGSVSVR